MIGLDSSNVSFVMKSWTLCEKSYGEILVYLISIKHVISFGSSNVTLAVEVNNTMGANHEEKCGFIL